MANQTLNAPYTAYMPISFNLSAGQSTTQYSVGSWQPLGINSEPVTLFQCPNTMQFKLIDIRQSTTLTTDLIFSYIFNAVTQNMRFDVNQAYAVNNASKAVPPTITINPTDFIQFIAYPTEPVTTAATEVVNAVFLVSPVQQVVTKQ
jgi:hypothetical protein